MLTLYQFPISHYCEKVRWALDHKKLDYQVKNLLPGMHDGTATKLAGSSSLPILVHDGQAIQNSSDIINYLDLKFPDLPLTPAEPHLQKDALAWEKFADEQIGVSVRLVCYHVLLEHPRLMIPLLAHNGAWYALFLMKVIFPTLSKRMRALMKINDKTAESANKRLGQAIDKVFERLQKQEFLVGNCFSRADLAVAALLAPLCKVEKYGLDWPQHFPEALEDVIAPYSEKIAWVNTLYAEYR